MTRKQKAQRIIGIVLLVVLLVPVLILLRPATYVDYVSHFPAITEHTYIPLVELLRTVDGTFDDVSFLAVYVGLLALAIWLIVRSTRYRRTQ